jgi:hypothetical protein
MKKTFLFSFSFMIALGIYFYTKIKIDDKLVVNRNNYKTFVKNPNRTIASYSSTNDELDKAQIGSSKKKVAEDLSRYPLRSGRILVGESAKEFEDPSINLEVTNKANPNWKSILGMDLLRMQDESTKVIINEEFPIIKLVDGKGRYYEQVIITYLLKNGDRNSYRALVDSESGLVMETWDRTIHEHMRRKKVDLAPIPMEETIKR